MQSHCYCKIALCIDDDDDNDDIYKLPNPNIIVHPHSGYTRKNQLIK